MIVGATLVVAFCCFTREQKGIDRQIQESYLVGVISGEGSRRFFSFRVNHSPNKRCVWTAKEDAGSTKTWG